MLDTLKLESTFHILDTTIIIMIMIELTFILYTGQLDQEGLLDLYVAAAAAVEL